MCYAYSMRLDKQTAFKLRLQGRSYSEISSALGIPKSTLSDWFRTFELPDAAQERLKKHASQTSRESLIKRNKLKTQVAEQKAQLAHSTAQKDIGTIGARDLFMIGVSLYWTKGYKKPIIINGKIKAQHAVSITNSDPQLVKIFLRFLRETCTVAEEKVTVGLRITEHQNAGYLLDFWSKTTGISPNKFQKVYYGKNMENNILPYGTVQIRVNNTELYHKIMGWIDGLRSIT